MRARYAGAAVRWLLPIVMAAFSILYSVHYTNSSQAAAARQAAAFERKICTTLAGLASREPPAAPPGNPSRAYLQWQHGMLAQLAPDVGCKENP